MKRTIVRHACLSLLISLVFTSMALASEPSGAIKLGLDLATATADQKSLNEGLKKVGQDKLDEWMWDSIGGYEMLLTSRSEAGIPGAKDKLKQIVEVVQSIEKFAIAITEGKYDDALFTAIDQTVSIVNHPLVSVTWAACKMTYESHKLVQETKAAADIERLYGLMSNDRRLMGTGGSKDAPPQLPETSASADYFFEKYVITDAAARAMFRSYVEKEIGEDWPEESWGEWAKSWMAIGSGVDTAQAAETALLAGEWRNKARTWIMRLIKDVNNQAKVYWAQTRARQQLAAFEEFRKRVGHFYNNDFEQMVREFQSIQKHKAALPQYRDALAQSQKERPNIKAKIDSKDYLKERNGAQTVNTALTNWTGQTYSVSTGASIGGDPQLAQALMDESKAWREMRDAFSKELETKTEDIIKEQAEEVLDIQPYPYNGMMRWNNLYARVESAANTYYAKYFEKAIESFDFGAQSLEVEDKSGKTHRVMGDMESLKNAMTGFLNEGRFDLAGGLLKAFDESLRSAYILHHREMEAKVRENSKTPGELTAAVEAYRNIYDSVSQRVIPLHQQASNISQSASEAYRRCTSGYYQCQAIYDRVRPQIQAIYNQISALWQSTYPAGDEKYVQEHGWGRAWTAGSTNLKTVQALDGIVMNQNRAALWELYNVFESLRRSREAQYKKYMTGMNRWNEFFDKDLRRLESWQGDVEERLKELGENAHTYLVARKDSDASLAALPGLLQGLGNRLQSGIISPDAMSFFEPALGLAERKFEEIKSGWDNLPVLSRDEIEQIQVLVNPAFDYLKEKKRIEQEMAKVKVFTSNIRAMVVQFERIADTDADNRAKDATALHLNAARVQSFLDEMQNRKMLKYRDRDYRIDVTIDPASKMVILDQPYKRYARVSDIQQIIAPVKAAWQACGAGAFVGKYMPDHARAVEEIINLSEAVAAKDENFIMNTGEVIYAGDIKKAAGLIASLKPGSAKFDDVMKQVAALLPRVLNVRTDTENKYMEGMAKNIYKVSLEEYKTSMRIPPETFTVRESALEFGPTDDHAIGKAYRDVVKKLDPLTKEHLAFLRAKANEEQQKKYDAEENRRRAEQEKANKQAAAATMGRGLADYYGYYVLDPRINSYSLANARGDVVLTRDEIQQGSYQVTGRMATLQRVEKLLISVDGGRGWNELPLAEMFSYSFTPMPDVPYQFLMRVQTVDQDDITFAMLQGVNSIVYKDVSFKNLVLETVKAIAEAYERADAAEFSNFISRDYLGQRVFLEEGIRFDFDMFTDIRLTIYVNRIEIRSNRYVVETNWQKSQTPRQTGEQQRTSGRTTFTFALEDGMMKIFNLRGDLLYATLSPEIAQASGLNSALVEQIRTARDERNPIQPGAGSTQDSGGLDQDDSGDGGTGGGGTGSVLTYLNVEWLNFDDFNFDLRDSVGPGEGDVNLILEWANQFMCPADACIQRIGGATQLSDVTIAPNNSYQLEENVVVNAVYVLITRDGRYVKMKVNSITAGTSISMDYGIGTVAGNQDLE